MARMASACVGSLDSMLSARSLARNPTVASARVSVPARGPKPNMATNRMATMTSWNVRDSATMPRHTT